MLAALTYLGVSVGILSLLTFLYVIEDAKGKRLFFPGVRASLDSLFLFVLGLLGRFTSFFTHGFMRLLLHYSAHKILKRILSTLQKLEAKVENMVRHNRNVAKTIKEAKEKSHLETIAEHKEEVALSEEEKRERRSR